MDADSSYGGSDTAQDSTCGNENSSLENTTIMSQNDTSQNDVSQNSNNLVSTISVNTEENPYYNKNEITLPVNRDETDFKSENSSTKLPHYLTTANLNINETLEHHSNLEALSKQYRSTSYLNADSESPPSHRKSGLDNPAFDDDEEAKEKQSIKSSFDQSKPYNGDLNLSVNSSIQNDEPLTEAVNLELINLKPSGKDVTGPYENGKNGMTSIPMKPDVDAELGNPYDEYFVPVNEHKKYMRGEKLYVTMDKRNVKKKSRCLCWGVCISIVLAAVIVGILAAVGVIGTKPVQEVSSRQFSGSTPEVKTGGIFGLPADLDTSDTFDETSPKYTPGPSSSTVPYPLTTDMSDISVPRALESQIKIDNMEFDQDYLNKNSRKFQELASTIEAELKEAIFTEDELMYGPADIEVKVVDFMEGSIIARYRITWKFKDGLHNTKDPIDANLLEERMAEKMRENHNHLSVFQINEEASMNKTMRVLDSCKIQNFGCEYKCLFNYTSAEFVCLCPEGEFLNENGKNCDKTASSPLPEPTNANERPLEPIPDPTPEPELHAEPERIPKVYSETTPEPLAEPTSEPHAEPNSEPHAEPTSEPHAEPTYEPHAEPTSEPHAEPTSEPHSEPTSEPRAEPTSKPLAELTSEPQAEPTSKPLAELTSEPQAEPTSEPHAEPTSEPHAEPTSEPHAEPTSEPHVEPTSEPHAEPTSEPHAEPTSEPHAEPTYEPHAEPTSEPHAEPTSEPHSEPTSEPRAEPTSKPLAELTSEPQAEPTSEPHAEPTSEPHAEPTSEPHAEPTSEPHAEPTSEPHAEPTSEPHAEPTSEPHAEPTSEPHAEPTSEPQAESTSETKSEPSSEPHVEPTVKPHIEPTHEHKESVIVPIQEFTTDSQTEETLVEQTTEPQAEPTSEPLAEPAATSEIQSSSELILKAITEPSSTPDSTAPDETLQQTTEPRSESDTEASFEKEFITFKPPSEPQTTSSTLDQSIKSVTQMEELTEVNRNLSTSVQPEVFITSTETSRNSEFSWNDLIIHSMENAVTQDANDTKNENVFNMEVSTQSEPLVEQESTTEPLPQFVENQSFETSSNVEELHQNETSAYPESKTELPLTSESNSSTEILPDFNTEMSVVETGRGMNKDRNISLEEHSQQSSNEISTLPSLPVDLTEKTTSNETIPIIQITTVIPPTTLTPQVTELGNAITLKNENSTSSVIRNNSETSQEGLVTINPNLFGQNLNEEVSTEILIENVHVFNKTMEGVKLEEIVDESKESNETEKSPEVTDQLTTPRHVEDLTESTNKKISETHQDILMNEPNEYSNHLEIMSPFLPEIENDTFINSLRSDDHFVDHNMHSNIDSSDEYILTTKAPRLDNDQQNKTNPLDPNPTDAMAIDKENFIKEQATESFPSSIKPINENVGSNFRMGKKDDSSTENVTSNDVFTESENIKTEEIITTEPIPSEILNNVHSNSIFDKMEPSMETTKLPENSDGTTFEGTTMASLITESTHSDSRDKLADVSENIEGGFTISSAESNNIVQDSSTSNDDTKMSSSTEDLIAMETTTYGMKTNPAFKFSKKSKSIKYMSEQNKLQDNMQSTEGIQQKQPELSSQTDTNSQTYEVEETVVDSTTTTKLFVTKPATINPLLFAPIEEQKELNNFSETTNTLNDIFNEDLLNKSGKIEETTSSDKGITTQMLTESYKNNMNNEKYYGKELRFDEPLLTTLNEIATKSGNDVKPVTEGFSIMGFTRCESDQFQCINGTSISNGKYCIPMVDRCDSVIDCSDGSDEIKCQEEGCPNNFQCSSGQCLKRHLVCDGIVNCNDNSDEINCESWNCTSSEFSCGENDRCIPSSWRCDGRSHCKDSSDENGCNMNECPDNHFRCSEGGICIPNAWRCDGKTDCSNAEDEKECGCSNNEFKCKIGGGCINLNQVCDGVSDCGDKSDEWKCLTLNQSTAILEALLKNETSLICSTNWNATYSDLVCEAMGYDSSVQYEEIATPSEATKLLKIKDNALYGLSFLKNLENVSSCEKVVTVKCQKSACGIKSDSVPIIGDSIHNETYNLPSLTLLFNNKQNVYCSGSLISQSWVVTAYSCIVGSLNGLDMSPDDWVVKIGGQQRMVVDFIEHPKVKFSNFYYNNDVVLIKLDRPVTSMKNVSAMCVPETVVNETQRCALAGWKNIKGEAAKKQYFHSLTMPLITIQECNSTKHYNGMMSEGEICVESKQPDNFPCYDDIGAPLLCLSEKTEMWELQGILSHSNKCEVTRHPLVYTSVNKDLVTWIENTIGQSASAISL